MDRLVHSCRSRLKRCERGRGKEIKDYFSLALFPVRVQYERCRNIVCTHAGESID